MNVIKLEKQKIYEFNIQKNQLLELQEIILNDNSNGLANSLLFVYKNSKTIFMYTNIELIHFFEKDENAEDLILLLNNVVFLNEIDYIKEKARKKIEENNISQSVEQERQKTLENTNKILELENENYIITESLFDEVEKVKEYKQNIEKRDKKLKEIAALYKSLKEENKKYKNHITRIGNERTPQPKVKEEIIIKKEKNIIKSKNIKIPDITKNEYPKETFEFLEKIVEELEKRIESIKKDIEDEIEKTQKEYIKELNKQKKEFEKQLDKNDEQIIEKSKKIVSLKEEHEKEIKDIKKLLEKELTNKDEEHNKKILQALFNIHNKTKK